MGGEAHDRTALITGAGSPTGIGFASAQVLGREGARLAIVSTTERIHERAAELHAMGYDAAGFVADLTDRSQVRAMVDAVVEAFGPDRHPREQRRDGDRADGRARPGAPSSRWTMTSGTWTSR